jgi:hypothetical protein
MLTLVTPTTLQRYEDIASNVKPERIKIFIQKAQELDLKSFLGYALYYDLIKNLDSDGTLKEGSTTVLQRLAKWQRVP